MHTQGNAIGIFTFKQGALPNQIQSQMDVILTPILPYPFQGPTPIDFILNASNPSNYVLSGGFNATLSLNDLGQSGKSVGINATTTLTKNGNNGNVRLIGATTTPIAIIPSIPCLTIGPLIVDAQMSFTSGSSWTINSLSMNSSDSLCGLGDFSSSFFYGNQSAMKLSLSSSRITLPRYESDVAIVNVMTLYFWVISKFVFNKLHCWTAAPSYLTLPKSV